MAQGAACVRRDHGDPAERPPKGARRQRRLCQPESSLGATTRSGFDPAICPSAREHDRPRLAAGQAHLVAFDRDRRSVRPSVDQAIEEAVRPVHT